eukprot:TRINITY_DN948_c0_g1_i1.p2 TRINITY_DN948_c0_g1~~TRINITY_DN948_c0_g1_i1.p2  ORF type:complete len:420 (+),score=94.19 TRINITY_DN948_c0_g1_i1:3-1262(+)
MTDLNELLKKQILLCDDLASLLHADALPLPDLKATILAKFATATQSLDAALLVVEDLKYTIKTSDEDQKAIYGLFLDCSTSLKNLFAQMDAQVKRVAGLDVSGGKENPKAAKKWKKFVDHLKSSLELVDDNVRGLLETFSALSESQTGGGVSVKPTVPVTIVTGFLGSGKTTFLNYILSANHGKRIAVIENEFGEVGIDDALVKDKFSGEEEIFQMNNGCICCTVRGDLIKALGALLEKSEKFDYIIIETTGLADPAPIVQTFFSVPEIGARLRVDGIVTLVDCKHILQHLEEKSQQGVVNEAEQQIAFADVVLLNKTDLVTPEVLQETKSVIQNINKMVEVHPTQRSVIPLNKILNIRSFDLNKITELDPQVLLREQHDHEPGHDHKETKITQHKQHVSGYRSYWLGCNGGEPDPEHG